MEKKVEIDLLKNAFNRGLTYWGNKNSSDVFPSKKDQEKLDSFDEKFPQNGHPTTEIIEMLDQYGSPNTVSQIGGRYFGFVTGAVLPSSMAARIMTDFWDQNSAMQVSSPVNSKLESVVEKWLIDLFDLPTSSVCGFVSGSTVSTFCGLAAARFHLLMNQGWNVNLKGLSNAPKLRIIMSQQIHGSVLKAINLLGFGQENVEWVETDEHGRIIPSRVPEIDDLTILVLQAGNVNTGSFDPCEELCLKAKEKGAWVHIDGAFGLWAYTSNDLKHLLKGVNGANSWSLDCHKSLNTPYDGGLILCENKEALSAALSIQGEYLQLAGDRDSMLFTPEMSKRARVFEIWAALKSLGAKGLDEMITQFHLLAKKMAKLLADNDFTILNDIHFNQILVFYESSVKTMKILNYVQNSGICWCGSSAWKGQKVIRVSICSWNTSEEDIKKSVEVFINALASTK